MFTVPTATSFVQNATKSSIQRYLKTRENHHLKYFKYFQRNKSYFTGEFDIESTFSAKPANFISDFNFKNSFPNDLENQNDFSYSQKLFHISDGNLYSIFSPIQGRSYGMKPSFLRKQKYTVQECHSRGRKNMRKGLKFHNFLPSESVTSEKGNGPSKSKWKVHSECRLREEHGTKQITISNWSQSVPETSDDPLSPNSVPNNYTSCTANQDDNLNTVNKSNVQDEEKSDISSSYGFKLSVGDDAKEPLESLKELNTVEQHQKKDCSRLPNSKKGSLKSVLNSLLDKPLLAENNTCDLPEAHTKFMQSQKHRRKPVQTRRVVPYTQYLSIMEEDDSSPLDLSSRCLEEKCSSPKSISGETKASSKRNKFNCDDTAFSSEPKPVTYFPKPSSASSLNPKHSSTVKNNDIVVNQSSLAHLLQKQIVPPLVLLSSPLNRTLSVAPTFSPVNGTVLKGKEIDDQKHQLNRLKLKTNYSASHSNPGTSFSGNMQYAVHKSFVKNSQPKSKRRSQRSTIKKNLEDTFKQNGFLVKTKQVSDGEATFCKFRQLRKYTRYYLKSWQQHLPDEVHKIWKGFLPPKTILPSVSGTNESTDGFH